MSLFLDGIGAVVKKVVEWIPSKLESKKNKLERLIKENVKLQQKSSFTAEDSAKYYLNADAIKQLRQEISRIRD